MPFNRYENVSTANPMPVQEVAGTYNAKENISASNPLPVMEIEDGSYSNYETVSSSNPQPVAIIADSGTYTRTEEYSDTNAFPVKFITGQTYDPRFDVSETNPWPVVVISGGGEEYEGPLDIVSGAVVAYGQRALSAAMLGQPYATLHRYSDDAELEFDFDAEDGSVDSAAIETWTGEELAAVTQWNDQSGNSKHAVQATLATMPDWMPDALGSLPAMRYTAGKVLLASSVSVTQPAYTVFAVLSRTANAVVCGINETGDDYLEFIARNAEITLEQYEDATGDDVGGTFIPDPALGTSHHLIDVVLQQHGTHECRVDGLDAPASGNFDSGNAASLTGSFGLGGDVASGNLYAGDLIEIIVYNAALTSEQRLAIRQNIQAYYGTPALP